MEDVPKASCDPVIARAVDGDRESTELLFLENYDRLEGRIAFQLPKSLQSVIQVRDVLHDTFMHAIRSLPHCQATTRGSFAAWLEAIATHRVLDAIRHHKAEKRGGGRLRQQHDTTDRDPSALPARDSTPRRNAIRNEVVDRVQEAVNDLPEDQRLVVQQRYLQGSSLETTAEALGRSPAAVRGLLHRAKRKLREVFRSSSRWLKTK